VLSLHLSSSNMPLPKFFDSLLGSGGANVMRTLAKTSAPLEAYLSPRIVVGWLRQCDYGDVSIPNECPLRSLSKSGYGYSGEALVQGVDYSFQNVTEEHIAAIISVALGNDIKQVAVKDVDLARLAKTIDLLCKAAPRAPANQFEHQMVAQAIQPEAPKQPDLVQPAQNKTKSNKIPKIPKVPPKIKQFKPLKVTKSETQNKCDICDGSMFEGLTFTGCTCFAPMAKSCQTTWDRAIGTICFGDDWDEDSVLTLTGVLKDAN
jgi:hypothetical protein